MTAESPLLTAIQEASDLWRRRHRELGRPAARVPSPEVIEARLADARRHYAASPVLHPKIGHRRGWCSFCRRQRPTTHVVKFPPMRFSDDDDTVSPRALRSYVCVDHAAKIVTYQHSIGVAARAYRYRRL